MLSPSLSRINTSHARFMSGVALERIMARQAREMEAERQAEQQEKKAA
jgi:hypothetical protein